MRNDMPFEEKLAILAQPSNGILDAVKTAAVPKTRLHVAVASVRMPEEVRVDRAAPLWAAGKGVGEDAARRVLTLEAAERYSSLFDATEPLLLGAVAEMAVFDLETVFQFSNSQYADEPKRFGRLGPVHELLWAPARSLADGSTVPIPAGCVYLEYIFEAEPWYYSADTNGCAAGENIARATDSALLELIERDALAIWWYNQAPRPELLLDPGEMAIVDEARACLADDRRTLHLFDLTHDLGVPVVAATSPSSAGEAIYLGAAADPDIRRAISRAIEELLLFWHWDRVTGRIPQSRRRWIERGSYQEFPFLRPYAQTPVENAGSACAGAIQALTSGGFSPYVVELTRPLIGIPVVRAVVPGLRHYGRRLGPGRLYRVPVNLGWIPRETPEAEMNPYPVPL